MNAANTTRRARGVAPPLNDPCAPAVFNGGPSARARRNRARGVAPPLNGILTATLAAIAVIAVLPGCMNSILPEMLQTERSIAKNIELQKAQIAQAETALAKLKIDAEAAPTPENIAAVKALDADTSRAKIALVSTELDLDEIKAEIAEARRIGKETGQAAAETLTAYGGPWGPLLAGLVPFAGLLIRNVYTGKAQRQKDAAAAQAIKALDPTIRNLDEAELKALSDRMPGPAKAFVKAMKATPLT